MKKWYWVLVFGLALVLGLAVGALNEAAAEPEPGRRIQLPILNHIGDSDENVETWIEVQNVGWDFTKAALVLWGEPGQCAPQCNGPMKIECSGLLKPGTTWNFRGAKVPAGAKSGIVYALSAEQHENPNAGDWDYFADGVCERLFETVVGDCDDWRRFDKAFREGLEWDGFDFGEFWGMPLAVEVWRKGPGDDTPEVSVTASYSGISDWMEGAYDPVFGGYAYYAPLVYAEHPDPPRDFTTWIYLQNSGDECTSVELWFQKQEDCLRATICEVDYLAPGETYQFDASTCVGPSFVGSVWIRTSQPMGIIVDQVGRDLLMAYQARPAQLDFTWEPDWPYWQTGSQVAFGPLIYREYQSWESLVQVQNLSSIVNAKVKVYFVDASGDIITTLVDWICPRGSQSYYLPVINDLPGHYVGAVRVESQEWWTPGDPKVYPPDIQAIAELIKYEGPAKAEALEAIAYNLFPEWEAYDWQVGEEWWWGTDVIAIPSILKGASGLTTELAIQNVVAKPGFTDFAIYIYDQNGLLDYVCEKLNEKQVEYINLDSWGYINPGFKGSAVISVTSWEHHGSFSPGLAAVKVERSGTVLSSDIPGDESAGSEGFPIWGPEFHFQGPQDVPPCPGDPGVCTWTLSGTVLEALDLKPIEDAEVAVETGPWEGVTFTDSTGNYSIEVPAGEGYTWVEVTAFGHEADGALIDPIECFGSYQQNFELYPDCDDVWVGGWVEDKMTGFPVEGADVWAENCVDFAEAVTNADGFYELELDFDPECTTWVCAGRWVDDIMEYNISCDSVFIPKCDTALIDFQLHQTPRSRVLLYYGNGGLGDGQEGLDYTELARFFEEEFGLIVDYTDQWPDEFDWTLKYKLIVLLGPGHDSEDDLLVDGFTWGQKADLDEYLQQHGWLVVMSDSTAWTWQEVENDLLNDLPVDLQFGQDAWTSGHGDQITADCLTTNVFTYSAIDAGDDWTSVFDPNASAAPGILIQQNAGSGQCPDCGMYAADVPSHGNGMVMILGDLDGLSDWAAGPADFNWPADNEWLAFNWIACDP